MRSVDHPRSGCAASPSRGQRQWPGKAGSTAFAWRAPGAALVLAVVALLGACSSRGTSDAGVTTVVTPVAVATPSPQVQPTRAPPPSTARVRNWDEYRVLAGQRLVSANPNLTYLGEVPEPLLAIPVLEIELNGDGSVRRVNVTRRPGQALDTVQLAVDAVYRAGPYGEVSHLPRPWRFTEVFLFRDDRRFKPRSLDQ